MNEIEEDSLQEEIPEHLQVIPPEPERFPLAYRYEGRLYIEEGADPPVEHCICCGRKSAKTIRKALRNPRNPLSWFGKTTPVSMGLCRRHADNNNIGIALTWSLLAVGVLLVGTGIATMSIPAMAVGVVAATGSGIFRAIMPVHVASVRTEPIEIRGFSPKYLEKVPEYAEVVLAE